MIDSLGITRRFEDLLSSVRDEYADIVADTDLRAAAIRLCELDGGDPNSIVMGYSGQHLAVAGRSKKMVLLQSPIRPLWTHYLNDAENAFGVVAEIEAAKAKPGAKKGKSE